MVKRNRVLLNLDDRTYEKLQRIAEKQKRQTGELIRLIVEDVAEQAADPSDPPPNGGKKLEPTSGFEPLTCGLRIGGSPTSKPTQRRPQNRARAA